MDIFQRIAKGIGIGSFLLLLYKLLFREQVITEREILFVLFLSVFIGGATAINRIEKLNYLSIVLIHLISTYIFSYFLSFVLNGELPVNIRSYTLTFVSIYAIVWVSLVGRNYLRAKLLNKKIQTINTRHSGNSTKKEE